MRRSGLACGEHGGAAFAKAYAGCAGLLAPAGKNHGIAVEQDGAASAIGQGQRLFVAFSDFQQRTGFGLRGAGQRARAQQVAGRGTARLAHDPGVAAFRGFEQSFSRQ